MAKIKWKDNPLIVNIVIPIVILIVYCVSYQVIASWLHMEGVNVKFVSRLWKYAALSMVGVCIVYFVIVKIKGYRKLKFLSYSDRMNALDLLLLLLPMTPVVQYICNNQDILSTKESIYVFVFFIILSSLSILVIPFLLSRISSTRILVSLGLAFTSTITSMALISQQYHWFGKGSLKIQLMFFGCVFLLTWLLYRRNLKVIIYTAIVVFFISNSIIQLFSIVRQTDGPVITSSGNQLLSLVKDKSSEITTNIYLLIYDAYVINETMLAYGIDNGDQEEFIKEQGFTIYPNTYSVDTPTLASISKVFDISTVPNGNPRRIFSGDGLVQNILREHGYLTYGVFPTDYFFQGVKIAYDVTVPELNTPPYKYLISSIVMGEFRSDIGFDYLKHDQFVEDKHTILNEDWDQSVFIHVHTDLPSHSLFSGACQPDGLQSFNERLLRANIEMRQDITAIINRDPGAIVIIAGDHGPFLTKNCHMTSEHYQLAEITRLDIQDRFGTFLAIRWPTEDYIKFDDIIVLQDLFPVIFAYLYRDPGFLDFKIEPIILYNDAISGASVNNGIIEGGIDDGEPLFISGD